MEFELKNYAKWILSGEHAVLQGGKALAFPLRNFYFQANGEFSQTGNKKEINVESCNEELIIIIKKLLISAIKLFNIKPFYSSYKINFAGNIPIKCGLGSSAAICVLIAKIVSLFIPNIKYNHLFLFSVAKTLENNFHKKSSGLDVAVSLFNKPIIFENCSVKEILSVPFWPHLGLSFSGTESLTAECAQKVQRIRETDLSYSQELDNYMNESANMCEIALKQGDPDLLRAGIDLGCDVFRKWGLVSDKLDEHIKFLKSQGAIAAKPIGSGLGGCVVSLWPKKNKNYEDICLTLENP